MNIYVVFNIIAFFVYFFLGLYVLLLEKGSWLNRVFFLLFLCLSVWVIGVMHMYTASSESLCWKWYRFSLIGHLLISPLILHYFMLMTRKNTKSRILYFLIYLPTAVVFYQFFVIDIQSVIRHFTVIYPGKVTASIVLSFWYYFNFIHLMVYALISLVISLRWEKRTKQRFERKQSLVIILTGTLTLVTGTYVSFILPVFYNIEPGILTPVTAVPWSLGIWYTLFRYKLAVLTPSLAANSILDTMVDSFVLVDPDLKILSVNRETCKLLEYDEAELKGQQLALFFNIEAKSEFKSVLSKNPIRGYEAEYRTKSGKKIPVVFSASENKDHSGKLLGIVLISRDITERKIAEERLRYQAHHDFLTGLPNRLLFIEQLRQALSDAKHKDCLTAVILLDVDSFKEVNDVFGHSSGDNLLVEIAERLKDLTRNSDIVSRFGGDEFTLIINELKCIADAEEIAERILKVFAARFTIDSQELHITPSIGISIFPLDGNDTETLVKNADLAMYHAKKKGKNNYQLFTHSLSTISSEKMIIGNSLKKAVERNEFIVHYQPMVNMSSGRIICLEALVRWQHPEYGLLMPAKFISIAEETGIIADIGEYVLRVACMQARQWIENGFPPLPVSVNISAIQLQHNNFVQMVLTVLKETELDPHLLELEITESTAMNDVERTVDILSRLNSHGISFTIDDFGIGYSSFCYLQRLPIQTIKIDKSFIQNITTDSNKAAIVTAIFAMAHAINLKVIAEGVETLFELELLHSLANKQLDSKHCDGAQGYYFSRPVSAEDIRKLLCGQMLSNKDMPIE